jgi:hypothetical protein
LWGLSASPDFHLHIENGRVRKFQGQGVVTADLIASYGDAGNWRGRYWHTIPATVAGNVCRATLPAGTLPCYVSGSVNDQGGYRYSTPLTRVDFGALGVKAATAVPDYDGCAEWGGFEDAQLAYLARHDRSGQARWLPSRSTDARDGKYSAVLKPGRTLLPPILSTAEIPHHLRCYLKAEKPVEVVLQLAGRQKQFQIASDWTEVGLDYTPPNDIMGQVAATITVPEGGNVFVDAVSFHPVLGGR